MSAKKFLTFSAVVLVAVIYYYLYKDSFSRGSIHISVNQRPRIARARRPAAAPAAPEEMMIFTLAQDYRLTEIRIVPLAALQTNKYPHPLWHLVSESNSIPVRTFIYGQVVRGMHPAVKGAPADPLSPATGYRVTVAAGSVKGQYDFHTRPEQPSEQ